jgi:hypothetical protein
VVYSNAQALYFINASDPVTANLKLQLLQKGTLLFLTILGNAYLSLNGVVAIKDKVICV